MLTLHSSVLRFFNGGRFLPARQKFFDDPVDRAYISCGNCIPFKPQIHQKNSGRRRNGHSWKHLSEGQDCKDFELKED